MFDEQGDLYDYESLLRAIKQVDVVISSLAREQLADQDKVIEAIKEAGNVKVDLLLHLIIKVNIIDF